MFNATLFEEFRCRPVRAKVVRQKVLQGALPALPISRVDRGPMCVGYHVKGMCNEGCPRAVDHVAYNTAQYAEMKAWCDANYPTSE